MGYELVREPQDIDNFPYQYGKLLLFEHNPDKSDSPRFPIPKLSWKDSYDRLANQGFMAAEYYMSVLDVDWYACALYGLNDDMRNLEFEKRDPKHLPGEDVLPDELKAKFEEKIRQCEEVLEELKEIEDNQ